MGELKMETTYQATFDIEPEVRQMILARLKDRRDWSKYLNHLLRTALLQQKPPA